jgi:hypothetical protein
MTNEKRQWIEHELDLWLDTVTVADYSEEALQQKIQAWEQLWSIARQAVQDIAKATADEGTG